MATSGMDADRTGTTGADILWQCLQREGVRRVFGYPGGAILPTYDAMTRYPDIHHVLARHEQGATHMADGYARASGDVGVVLATSGPGATNLVTGLGTAAMDSSPIVCITGQVPNAVRGSDAFQETDITGITRSVTKHNILVTDVDDLAYLVKEAFHIARSGRPGPVLIDIPKDVQLATSDQGYPDAPIRLPSDDPPDASTVGTDQLAAAIALVDAAERPLILAGQGVLLSGATDVLRAFAERAEIPVALTLLGKGGFPEEHPLCLGMMGMHGHAFTNRAIQEADLLLAFGMRFDDRVTGNLATYARHSKKIHVDIDPAEIGKNVEVDVGLVGDLGRVLTRLLPDLPPRRHREWLATIDDWREDGRHRDVLQQHQPGSVLLAAEVLDAIRRHTDGDAVHVTDVGQHQMWEAQYCPHQRPGTLFTSGGMGTMGFALPAAIGVKMARPDEEVWAIAGDGGFQMTQAELATAIQEGIEIKIAVVNNGYLGMVRQWQELF
ncbi:MAG: biosynthetic-type acetolactate synthase large subunit, partial [Acidobacteriota bacterium]